MLRSRTEKSLLAVAALLLACDASETAPNSAPVRRAPLQAIAQAAAGEAPEPSEPSYSPFVLRMREGSLPFAEISFKDVGMSLPEEERVVAYETLAESLALRLASERPDFSADVSHTVEILDPAAHVACEGRHIYVDLWQAGSGWGYSLWSGCGKDDEFAHREVHRGEGDPIASFEPLAQDIAEHLVAAAETGCFMKTC